MAKLIFSIFLLLASSAYSAVNMYAGLLPGQLNMNEYESGNTQNHRSQFFAGHIGGAVGGSYIFTMGSFGLGLKGEIAWVGNTTDRKLAGSSTGAGYRYESQRILGGAVVSIRPGPISFDLEYYPSVTNYVSFSDKKAENPFRKGDELKAAGYGAGMSFSLFPPSRNFIMFRKLNYADVEMDGVKAVLPNSEFTVLKIDEVLIGFGADF
jgi:hypothetical protein